MTESARSSDAVFNSARRLSPRRKTTAAVNLDELAAEQLVHFGIDPASPFGRALASVARKLYDLAPDIDRLWRETMSGISALDRQDRVAWFNAKKFLSFQLAKLLDTLQNPARKSYQSLGYAAATLESKGSYGVFDNVTAIFSATPVITRTATYIYACAEWIEDAFLGKELLLEIYSRLLNPTSISLANYIVDLEAGPYSDQYLAWNFSSGMAAIDATLSHLLGRDDILITSRNIYGGAHQLIHDWYAKSSNLEIAVVDFDGTSREAFAAALEHAGTQYAARLGAGRQIYVYLESPCNPHGYLLDVPGICQVAHAANLRVILDATVGTPFLLQPLARTDPAERPDFVIHSYTKDLSGTGSVIAGVVIARNEDMFIPKGEKASGRAWNETMFWNVYYVKGAFLNADSAFEVLQGIRTLEQRMLAKCINTLILARFLAAHPDIVVHCNGLEANENHAVCQDLSFLGLPSPLFTVEMPSVPAEAFERFFDSLAPTFGHMISLGQTNTIVSCPALTTHSELDAAALAAAGISPTTIRFAVGHEDPYDLLAHLVAASRLAIDPDVAGFSEKFRSASDMRELIESTYIDVHRRYIEARRRE